MMQLEVRSLFSSFRARLETAPLEQEESMKGEEEKEFTKEEDERPDFSDI